MKTLKLMAIIPTLAALGLAACGRKEAPAAAEMEAAPTVAETAAVDVAAATAETTAGEAASAAMEGSMDIAQPGDAAQPAAPENN